MLRVVPQPLSYIRIIPGNIKWGIVCGTLVFKTGGGVLLLFCPPAQAEADRCPLETVSGTDLILQVALVGKMQ